MERREDRLASRLKVRSKELGGMINKSVGIHSIISCDPVPITGEYFKSYLPFGSTLASVFKQKT